MYSSEEQINKQKKVKSAEKEAPPNPTKELFIGPDTGVGEKVLKKFLPIIEMVVRKEYKTIPSYLAEYSELINVGLLSINKLLNEVAKNNKTYNSSYIAQAVKWAIKDELRTKYNWYGVKGVKGVKQKNAKDSESDDTYSNLTYSNEEVSEDDEFNLSKDEASERVFETILYLEDLSHEALTNEQMGKDELARLELLELKAAVKRAIDKLPPKHKKVIELRFYEGKRGNDVASELGVTPSRVSHMIQDAIEKVRQSLSLEGFTELK